MTPQLRDRDIGVEIHAVNALTLESRVLVEYSIDVGYWCLLKA